MDLVFVGSEFGGAVGLFSLICDTRMRYRLIREPHMAGNLVIELGFFELWL